MTKEKAQKIKKCHHGRPLRSARAKGAAVSHILRGSAAAHCRIFEDDHLIYSDDFIREANSQAGLWHLVNLHEERD